MGKNKTEKPARMTQSGRYIKYAIGEIVLVVIGILIALQINNWNETRKNETVETEYLNGILTNLSSDILEINQHLSADTVRLDAYTDLIRTFNNEGFVSKEQEIISNLNTVSKSHWFEGQKTVFEDMKSSGKLYFIKSDTLRVAIQEYYGYFMEVIKQEVRVIEELERDSHIVYSKINTSSFIEPTFEARWNGNTGPPDLSFLEDLDDNLKFDMINAWSIMKSYEFSAHFARVELKRKAQSLSENIEAYLAKKE